ncbi:hypothetical protein BKA70DRAFT_1416924 [Coprinopsis sp. MPI-PUGE-AT-0042]|nr:hypothetical protein BKA70DRAFT_1416924 [Coprinopsis sp. MPI-PUGE-AT-0042]
MTDTSRPKKVYYLWNESAHPELDVSGYDVARALRAFGSKIGVIRSPCFSVDPPGRKRLVLPVASGLKYSSVSIVNEASNGRAGAASEISLADFVNHAMDSRNAPTAIIVIIPADFDLIHAFTTLRMNGRELLLSCPANEGRNLLRLSEGHVLNSEILKILPAPTPPSFASTQWVAGTSPTENTAKAQSTVPRAMTALAKSPTTATNP